MEWESRDVESNEQLPGREALSSSPGSGQNWQRAAH